MELKREDRNGIVIGTNETSESKKDMKLSSVEFFSPSIKSSSSDDKQPHFPARKFVYTQKLTGFS